MQFIFMHFLCTFLGEKKNWKSIIWDVTIATNTSLGVISYILCNHFYRGVTAEHLLAPWFIHKHTEV